MVRTNGNGKASGPSLPSFGSNPFLTGKQYVIIVASNNNLMYQIESLYNSVDARIQARGGDLLVSLDEFTRYIVTAYKVRAEHVLGGEWFALGYQRTGMSVRDEWALPTVVHSTLAAIGKARIGSQGTQITPLWDSSADEFILSKEQRDLITPKLRAAFQFSEAPYLTSVPGDEDGAPEVMVLTHLPRTGVWLSPTTAGLEHAMHASFAGLTPVTVPVRGVGGPAYEVIETDALAEHLGPMQLWIPPLTLADTTVLRYRAKFSQL